MLNLQSSPITALTYCVHISCTSAAGLASACWFSSMGYSVGGRMLNATDTSQHPGPTVFMKLSTATRFTQKFGIFFSRAAFSYPFLCWLWINAYHLHSWPAGQTTLWPCLSLCKPFTCTQLCCGRQRVDPHCLVRRRYQNFPTPQAGQEYQGQFAAVRLTDQLPATAGSTSCTPGEGRAMHWVFNTWITWPQCHIFCQITFFSWSL